MKKISLKGISEILSEKELKNVMGGSPDEISFGCPSTKCSSDNDCDWLSGRKCLSCNGTKFCH